VPKRHLACPFVVIKAKLHLFLHVSMTCQARHSLLVFTLCPAHPQRPLWSRDCLRVPDTVLDRAGRKGHLRRVTGACYMPDAPQKALGDTTGISLNLLVKTSR
jgi:hypothetical protein